MICFGSFFFLFLFLCVSVFDLVSCFVFGYVVFFYLCGGLFFIPFAFFFWASVFFIRFFLDLGFFLFVYFAFLGGGEWSFLIW